MSSVRWPSVLLVSFLVFTWASCPCLMVESAERLLEPDAPRAPAKSCACCGQGADRLAAHQRPADPRPSHPQDCPCPTCRAHGPNHGMLTSGEGAALLAVDVLLHAVPMSVAPPRPIPSRALRTHLASGAAPPTPLARPDVLLL